MKINELIRADLIGMTIDGWVITKDTPNETWNGNFALEHQNVASLKGAPKRVDGNFWCGSNAITSLEGAPSYVTGEFYCNHNKLTSLVGGPSYVGENFSCERNNITSMDGAPSFIGLHCWCRDIKLTSLEGIHRVIKRIGNSFDVSGNPITSNILGVIMIEGLTKFAIDDKELTKIMNRHVGHGKSALIHCQNELLDAGYEEFAKL